jgi:hypothetical protein
MNGTISPSMDVNTDSCIETFLGLLCQGIRVSYHHKGMDTENFPELRKPIH